MALIGKWYGSGSSPASLSTMGIGNLTKHTMTAVAGSHTLDGISRTWRSPRLNADELSRGQCRDLRNKLDPMVGYLHRLRVPMNRRGFPDDDPLMELVVTASAAMKEQHGEIFCQAMDGKRFKPPRSLIATRMPNLGRDRVELESPCSRVLEVRLTNPPRPLRAAHLRILPPAMPRAPDRAGRR